MPVVTQSAPWSDIIEAGNVLSVAVTVGGGVFVQRSYGGDVIESASVTTSRSFGPYLRDMTFRVSAMAGASATVLESTDTGQQPGAVSGAGIRQALLDLRPKLARSVMASPPSVTYGTTSTIASPRFWAHETNGAYNGQTYTYTRGAGPVPKGSNGLIRLSNVSYDSATRINNGEVWSVIHTGSELQIAVFEGLGSMLVAANDELISLTPQAIPNTGSTGFYYIPFGSVDTRRIDVYMQTNGQFFGMYTAPTGTLSPAPKRGCSLMRVGDSFEEGTGPAAFSSNAIVMSDFLQWDDVIPSGVGGTGFLATNSGTRYTYRQRLASDVLAFPRDLVLFRVSPNDLTVATLAEIQAEWAVVVGLARAGLPSTTRIGFVGPWCNKGPGNTPLNVWLMADAAKAFCAANNLIFISASEQSLPNGAPLATITLAAAATAGAPSISITTNNVPKGEVYRFPDGSRFRLISISGGGPFTAVIDNLATNQASGAVATQVGQSAWSGTGRVGATAGNGNCDFVVGTDGTHPTTVGARMEGLILTHELLKSARDNPQLWA